MSSNPKYEFILPYFYIFMVFSFFSVGIYVYVSVSMIHSYNKTNHMHQFLKFIF